ncbi:MAG: YfhO family protein [bacterium]
MSGGPRNSLANAYLILFILVLGYFFKLLLNLSNMGPGADVLSSYAFTKPFMAGGTIAGKISHWNPHIFCGHPFQASIQKGFFYPSHVLYVFVSMPAAISLDYAIHTFLAACFMFKLLKDFKLRDESCIAGGIFWAFSGFALAKFTVGLIAQMNTFVWLPLIFLYVRRLLRLGGLKNVGFLAIVAGLHFLGGYPQYWIYSMLAVGFYAIWWSVGRLRNGSGIKKVVSGWFLLFSGIVMSIGISLVQLLPSLEFISHSVVGTVSTGAGYAFMGSLSLKTIPALLAPSLLGQPDFGVDLAWGACWVYWDSCAFMGMWAYVLAAVAIRKSGEFPEGKFFFAVCIISLLFALGNNTPIYPLFHKLFMMPSLMRFPVRFLYLFSFAVSVLAAFGFEAVLKDQNANTRKSIFACLRYGAIIGTVVAAASLTLLLFRAQIWTVLDEPLLRLIHSAGVVNPATSREAVVAKALTYIAFNAWDLFRTSLVLTLGCVLFHRYYRQKIRKEFFAMSFLLVVFAELFLFAQPFIRPQPFRRADDGYRMARAIEKHDPASQAGPFRVISMLLLSSRNELMLAGLENVDGYESFIIRDYAEYIRGINRHHGGEEYFHANSPFKIKPGPDLALALAPMNVHYAVTPGRLHKNDPDWNPEHWKEIYAEEGLYIYKNVLSPDYAYFSPGEWKDNSGIPEILDFYKRRLENASREHERGGFHYEILERGRNSIRLNVHNSESGVLILSEVFYPAWKTRVDGKRAETMKVNGFQRGVQLEAGDHLVEMRYASKSFAFGLMGTAASIAIVILFLVMGNREKEPGKDAGGGDRRSFRRGSARPSQKVFPK